MGFFAKINIACNQEECGCCKFKRFDPGPAWLYMCDLYQCPLVSAPSQRSAFRCDGCRAAEVEAAKDVKKEKILIELARLVRNSENMDAIRWGLQCIYDIVERRVRSDNDTVSHQG